MPSLAHNYARFLTQAQFFIGYGPTVINKQVT